MPKPGTSMPAAAKSQEGAARLGGHPGSVGTCLGLWSLAPSGSWTKTQLRVAELGVLKLKASGTEGQFSDNNLLSLFCTATLLPK